MVSVPEPTDALGRQRQPFRGFGPGNWSNQNLARAKGMEPASDGMPNDVLIVEDDPIIALDFEDSFSASGEDGADRGSVAGRLP